MDVTTLPSWQTLTLHAERAHNEHFRDLVARDFNRGRACHLHAAGWTLDWSRQRVSTEVMHDLLALAHQRELTSAIEAMFTGKRINTTENRSVLHTALRANPADAVVVDGVDCVGQAHAVLSAMRTFTERVLNGQEVGSTGERFTDVVNIGIGGSDLGPVMVTESLRNQWCGLRPHFISNVDPADAHEKLRGLNPHTTLVLIASKTFTTTETMANARLVHDWLKSGLPDDAQVGVHLVALSTAIDLAGDFGIARNRVFGFWDWVGGRYSVGSAIGLSVMLSVGVTAFDEFLAGMRDMDVHFRTADLSENLPVAMGLLGIWNRNFLGIPTRAVLPYEQYLHRLPAYLQQLTMESNGKRVTVKGSPVSIDTAPVLWGEPGTNGQHSFHQLIHQGTEPVACDIIVFSKSHHDVADQHATLVANALAQAQVMALGRSTAEVHAAGVDANLVEHKVMPGNRPCTLLWSRLLTPRALGALIALYEHATFVEGVIWGINSFDQWGVEYGKEVATRLVPLMLGEDMPGSEIPEFTSATIAALRALSTGD